MQTHPYPRLKRVDGIQRKTYRFAVDATNLRE
jgi:hypothetical protein